ncbi:hypothetical protein O181_015283 [Austropuccinia psidii MF-1]|uniref:Uncharacterized protein n=1 Tax=Austropuccinia psidii MF-1 TaxID=1389203 RepID=A0A9Q3GPU4_9BASI|nr:hypothetical protein [Austropuccinia psidii MF-1]
MRDHLDRGPIIEGAAPSRKEVRVPRRSTLKGLGEDDADEEGSEVTEAAPASVDVSQGTGGPTLAQSNKPSSHQSEPSLLAICQAESMIKLIKTNYKL